MIAMLSSRIVPFLALGLCLGSLACDDDPPRPTGNLRSPRGLAYVPRSTTAEAGQDLVRSDLLVADSEAQGVRIVQYSEVLDEKAKKVEVGPWFVPAPVAFFKLTTEAPGLPNKVVIGNREGEERQLAFTLAPAEDALHLLEVGELPFATDSLSDTNIRLGEAKFGLAGLFPVDVEYLGRDGARHVLAVGFDGLGRPNGRVVVLALTPPAREAAPTTLVPETLGALDIPPGLSDLAWVSTSSLSLSGRILAASVATSTVSEFSFSVEGGAMTMTSTRAFGAGQPLSQLLVTQSLGVLGVAFDEPALVWMPSGPAGFARAQVELESPYNTESAPRGLLRTRPSPILAAAAATLKNFALPTREVVFEGGARDVLLLAHSDGRVTFVHADADEDVPLHPVISAAYASGATKGTIRRAHRSNPVNGGGVLGLKDELCPTPVDICDRTYDSEDPAYCTPANSIQTRVIDGLVSRIRVSPYGTLVSGLPATLDGAIGLDASGRLEAVIIDRRFPDFDRFQVRAGDAVRLGIYVDCEAVDGGIYTGEVLSTTTGADGDARIRVAVQLPADGALLSACRSELEGLSTVRSYEVHVPDDVHEAVVAGVSGERVLVVYERSAMTEDMGKVKIDIGGAGFDEAPFDFEVMTQQAVGTEPGAALATLACAEAVADNRSLEQLAPGEQLGPLEGLDRCTLDSDCPTGRVCVGASSGCPGLCSSTCIGTADCLDYETARICPTLTLQLSIETPTSLDLRSVGERTPDTDFFAATLASDAVFHEQRRSFIVSYPGSGTLIEIPVGRSGGTVLRVD